MTRCLRYTAAHDICARVQYRNTTIQAAADDIIQGVLKPIGGEGGVIGSMRTATR